jgi:biopolymer transport protein ExbD
MSRRRSASADRVDLQMTPMIDVVFQLLTFFLMSLRIAPAEGDFDLRLPREAVGPDWERPPEVVTLHLVAEPNGDLRHVQIEANKPLSGPAPFAAVHREVVRLVNICRSAGQEDPEVVIDADDDLRYEYLVAAVSAVASETNADGESVPLIKRVRFASPRLPLSPSPALPHPRG